MWGMRRTTESCVDVVVQRASFGPLHQDTVKPPFKTRVLFHAKKGVLQSGNPGPKAGELGRLEPCMMVGDDVGMAQCLEQVDLA